MFLRRASFHQLSWRMPTGIHCTHGGQWTGSSRGGQGVGGRWGRYQCQGNCGWGQGGHQFIILVLLKLPFHSSLYVAHTQDGYTKPLIPTAFQNLFQKDKILSYIEVLKVLVALKGINVNCADKVREGMQSWDGGRGVS